jgi:hypothetical protein
VCRTWKNNIHTHTHTRTYTPRDAVHQEAKEKRREKKKERKRKRERRRRALVSVFHITIHTLPRAKKNDRWKRTILATTPQETKKEKADLSIISTQENTHTHTLKKQREKRRREKALVNSICFDILFGTRTNTHTHTHTHQDLRHKSLDREGEG